MQAAQLLSGVDQLSLRQVPDSLASSLVKQEIGHGVHRRTDDGRLIHGATRIGAEGTVTGASG